MALECSSDKFSSKLVSNKVGSNWGEQSGDNGSFNLVVKDIEIFYGGE